MHMLIRLFLYFAIPAALLGCPENQSNTTKAISREILELERVYTLNNLWNITNLFETDGYKAINYDSKNIKSTIGNFIKILENKQDIASHDYSRLLLDLINDSVQLIEQCKLETVCRDRNLDLLVTFISFDLLPQDKLQATIKILTKAVADNSATKLISHWQSINIANLVNNKVFYLEKLTNAISNSKDTLEGKSHSYLIAHRGGFSSNPENTLEAMMDAASMQVDGFEFDIRLSADNIPVLSHDKNLQRVANQNIEIGTTKFHNLRNISLISPLNSQPSKSRVYSVKEILNNSDNSYIWLELKPDEPLKLSHEIIRILEQTNDLDRIIISSFSKELLTPIREKFPNLLIAYEYLNVSLEEVAKLANCDDHHRIIVSANHFHVFSKDAFEFAKKEKIMTSSYTLNRPEALLSAITDKVTFIQTDKPKYYYLAMQLLLQREQK
jgi:glycerophosphoryl diester phosphodiesterase